jgi:hypothetical protein
MATYNKASQYYDTSQNNQYLNLLEIRPVPAETDDIQYKIESQYRHRPDLLAYDLYGKPELWWVFVQRNMETIKDPIYDFEVGTIIFCPKKTNLEKYLGV